MRSASRLLLSARDILPVYEATRFCARRRAPEEDTQGGASHSHRRLVGAGDDVLIGRSQLGTARCGSFAGPTTSPNFSRSLTSTTRAREKALPFSCGSVQENHSISS